MVENKDGERLSPAARGEHLDSAEVFQAQGDVVSGSGSTNGIVSASATTSTSTSAAQGLQLAVEPPVPARVPWGALALFIAVAFALSWAVAAPLWVIGPEAEMFPILLPVFGVVMMFTPALGVLAALFIARTPRGERLRFLGMWPLRPARRVVWMVVAAIFWPVAIVIVSIAVATAFGWVHLDLVHFSGFAKTIAASVPVSAANAMPPIGLIVALQFAMIPLGAVINSVAAFGEEIGWRGWLLPALQPLGIWPALLISGVIWGLWHSPLILLGYNFGLTDWRGVALMTAGCVIWGVLLGWSRIRSGSVWPAVIGHGALNASGGLVMVVVAAGEELSPPLALPLGVAGWIAAGAAIVVLALCGQFSRTRRPGLAPPRSSGTTPAAAAASAASAAVGHAQAEERRSETNP